jgi:hypothetical protein
VSVFDEIAASADAAVDAVFGEPVRIEPRLTGGYTDAAADPDRPVRTVTGVIRMQSSRETLAGQSRDRATGLSIVGGRPTILHLSAAVLVSLGYPLRKGDRVIRVTKDADNAFEVGSIEPADLGDAFIHLVIAS